MIQPPSHAIVLTIPGELRGKGRPRFVPGRLKPVTDTKTRTEEEWVRAHALSAKGRLHGPLIGALALHIDLALAVPPSWTKRERAEALAGLKLPTVRPDADNVLKLVSDALNGVLWKDDTQIADLRVLRRYVETPQATIAVWQIP